METTHLNILVRGKVQGVWYRKSAVEMARKLGLGGYARNLPDGTVHIEVEGPLDQVEEFVNWCWEGPPLARVTVVERSVGPLVGYTAFETRR